MATNIYLKVENPAVAGETTDAKHAGQIEIMSWSHGFNQPTSPVRSTAGGGTVERANHSDLTLTKYTDASTPELLKNCWSGKTFGKMTLTQYRDDGTGTRVEYMVVELENVIISNYSLSAGAGDIPVENISLSYGKVTYRYDPQDEKTGAASGKVPASHDLMTNTIE